MQGGAGGREQGCTGGIRQTAGPTGECILRGRDQVMIACGAELSAGVRTPARQGRVGADSSTPNSREAGEGLVWVDGREAGIRNRGKKRPGWWEEGWPQRAAIVSSTLAYAHFFIAAYLQAAAQETRTQHGGWRAGGAGGQTSATAQPRQALDSAPQLPQHSTHHPPPISSALALAWRQPPPSAAPAPALYQPRTKQAPAATSRGLTWRRSPPGTASAAARA